MDFYIFTQRFLIEVVCSSKLANLYYTQSEYISLRYTNLKLRIGKSDKIFTTNIFNKNLKYKKNYYKAK